MNHILIFVLLLTSCSIALKNNIQRSPPDPKCSLGTLFFVESIPLNITIEPTLPSTYQVLTDLINQAHATIDICAMYMTLWEGNNFPESGGTKGRMIFDALTSAIKRGVHVRVIQTAPPFYPTNPDTIILSNLGAEMASINWPLLNNGSGVLHDKFMIIDGEDTYMGSANFDWRSMTQVKEFGVVIKDCVTTATDLSKVFNLYWFLKDSTVMPPSFPPALDTRFSMKFPMELELNGAPIRMFYSASPTRFNTPNRTNDIDALIRAINNAEDVLRVSVMDYAPITEFRPHDPFFWPRLDDALRNAAFRGVNVQLLFSIWNHTDPKTIPYMVSLDALSNLEVRVMVIPDQQDAPVVPFTRVSHSKYLWTEKQIYITTSNWTPDYFLFSGGVSLTVDQHFYSNTVIRKMWSRDWDSEYSKSIQNFSKQHH